MTSRSDQDTENTAVSPTDDRSESVAPSLPEEDGAPTSDPHHDPDVPSSTAADRYGANS